MTRCTGRAWPETLVQNEFGARRNPALARTDGYEWPGATAVMSCEISARFCL
jgi:hypothetical protein